MQRDNLSVNFMYTVLSDIYILPLTTDKIKVDYGIKTHRNPPFNKPNWTYGMVFVQVLTFVHV